MLYLFKIYDKFSEYKAYPKFFAKELKSLPENIKVITTF